MSQKGQRAAARLAALFEGLMGNEQRRDQAAREQATLMIDAATVSSLPVLRMRQTGRAGRRLDSPPPAA